MTIKQFLIQKYEVLYPFFRRRFFDMRFRFRVMSSEETVTFIKKTGCSIARFGDGEFGLITGAKKPSFQDADEELAMRLREVCRSEDKRVLVCVPHNFKSTSDCNEFARKFWDWWIWDNDNLKKAAECMGLSPWKIRVFGDAQLSRPYMDWKDRSLAGRRFDDLKSLWDQRVILIVEGTETRLGVGNDLFSGAKDVKRILCPARNAFRLYPLILETIKRYAAGRLVILALGPTATVLAYDLARSGYQALDIGHVDIEYEWFLRGVTEKTAVPGKYTQEAHSHLFLDLSDHAYLAQIVERIE